MRNDVRISANVSIKLYERQSNRGLVLVDERSSHNIMTNTGRHWLVRRLGASAFGNPPTPHSTETVKWMGFGVGGSLQTNPLYRHSQQEVATVLSLEDPTPISGSPSPGFTYLKQVDVQAENATNFPDGGIGRTVFVCHIAQDEISFLDAVSFRSQQSVGTHVPVSEAGLYLSGADPMLLTPTDANRLICYDTFDPIFVTPTAVLRCEWELRIV